MHLFTGNAVEGWLDVLVWRVGRKAGRSACRDKLSATSGIPKQWVAGCSGTTFVTDTDGSVEQKSLIAHISTS